MSADRQRRINRNSVATLSTAIALNITTSTKLIDSNSNRIFFCVTNTGNTDAWLKLQAASIDNDKKGIPLPARSYWQMPSDNIYTGEISAIAIVDSPDIYYTEY